MKKATLSMSFNVPDDFKPGNCSKCPMAISRTYETAMRDCVTERKCPFVVKRELCPLEIDS